MSRIGKKEIKIPSGVEIKIEDLNGAEESLGQKITVKGPKGELSRAIRKEITVGQEGEELKFTRKDDTKLSRSLHGLTRTLVNNMILGVTNGFEKHLEIHGVGYRAAVKGKSLDFQLGKSHPVVVEPPEGIEFKVENNTNIIITGYDKEVVGQIAANIIALRPPEPYKGKGIRLKGQRIKRKAGKSGAK